MFSAMQAAPLTNIAEFTVSELSSAIKRTVEDAFGLVRLRGEISGYRGPHSSGHAYLCLKDERSKIDAVIWRGTLSGLKFKPEEGLEVIVTGRVTTFPGKSSYQIIIEQLEPAGAGALMALLEERKKKFAAEGLFDDARKRPLPFWPRVVGIVTSPTGAVIRDMLHGFTERCPSHVIVWPVRVQGETSGAEVAAAIHGFNGLGESGPVLRPDLLIVARGGGSLEDLWGFNDEAVVRAVAASLIPVISAVGHETDWTLIDLVADARAPTPTKAAEWAVPKHSELLLRLSECADRMRRCVGRHLERLRTDFRSAERALPRPSLLLASPQQKLDGLSVRLGQSLLHFSHQARRRFDRVSLRLTSRLVLDRIGRASERLNALSRDAAYGFRGLIHRKQRGFEASALRLSPRLARAPFDKGEERLKRLSTGMARAFMQNAALKQARFDGASARFAPVLIEASFSRAKEKWERSAPRLQIGYLGGLTRHRKQLDATGQLLRSLSHKSVLERGFALVRDDSGRMVRRASAIAADETALEIEFADGKVKAQYSAVGHETELAGKAPKALTPSSRRGLSGKKDDDSQGTLL